MYTVIVRQSKQSRRKEVHAYKDCKGDNWGVGVGGEERTGEGKVRDNREGVRGDNSEGKVRKQWGGGQQGGEGR